jgi:transcriptional regulator with XRE-family HTH domain
MIRKSTHLAKFMKDKREALGLSQKQLSVSMGFSKNGGPQYISNTERGTCQFPIKHLPKLSAALSTDLDELKKLIVSDYELFISQAIEKKNEDTTIA